MADENAQAEANSKQAKPHDDQIDTIKDQQKAADEQRKVADVTTDAVNTDGRVSLTEHAMGGRQPDDGSYDALRQNAPLEGRDIPQIIVTAKNDTPTPGENV